MEGSSSIDCCEHLGFFDLAFCEMIGSQEKCRMTKETLLAGRELGQPIIRKLRIVITDWPEQYWPTAAFENLWAFEVEQ